MHSIRENGRAKATIYVGGMGSDADVAYVEWTQPVIKPSGPDEIPASIYVDDAEMRPHLLSYDLQIFEALDR